MFSPLQNIEFSHFRSFAISRFFKSIQEFLFFFTRSPFTLKVSSRLLSIFYEFKSLCKTLREFFLFSGILSIAFSFFNQIYF